MQQLRWQAPELLQWDSTDLDNIRKTGLLTRLSTALWPDVAIPYLARKLAMNLFPRDHSHVVTRHDVGVVGRTAVVQVHDFT